MILGLNFATDNSFSSTIHPKAQISNLQIRKALFKQMFITKKLLTTFDGTYDDTWTFDTVLSSKFENNLYGGNVNFTEKERRKIKHFKRFMKNRFRPGTIWLLNSLITVSLLEILNMLTLL